MLKYKNNKLFVFYAVAIFTIFSSPLYYLSGPHRSYDDASYISHFHTLVFDRDFDYSNEVAVLAGHTHVGAVPKHPVGPGITSALFVFPFSLIDRVINHPVVEDRMLYVGSWSFFAFFLVSSLAFAASIPLLFDALRRFGFLVHPLVVVLMLLSTGVVYYSLARFTMSHSFELFAGVLVVFSLSRFFHAKEESSTRYNGVVWFSLLALGTLLTLLNRPNNINVLLVPYILLLLLTTTTDRYKLRDYVKIFIAQAIALLVYGAVNLQLYGHFLPSMDQAYGGSDLSFFESIIIRVPEIVQMMPSIFLVLFSSEFGIFWSNPVVFFGSLGLLFWYITRMREHTVVIQVVIFVLLMGFFAVSFGVVVYWQTTASDYGFRYLFGLVPLCAVGYAWLIDRFKHSITPAAKHATRIMHAMLIFATLSVVFYKTSGSLWPSVQVNVFGVLHGASNVGYLWNLLSEMLRPATWALALGQGTLGFFVYPLIRDTRLMELVPPTAVERYLHLYDTSPMVVYVQMIVAMVIWGFLGYAYYWWLCRYHRYDELCY